MNRFATLGAFLALLSANSLLRADVDPPNGGRGAGTVPIWNPHKPESGNPPLTLRVLVLNYDPIVPSEGNRRLSEVFKWNNPAKMATQYKEAMEYASGGYLTFEVVEWRNLNEIYALQDGFRYTIEEYVKNRKQGKGWRKQIIADYPRILREQNVPPQIDDGLVDEVWIFSDHYFGLWEASMAGPGAFFINGGVYPQVPTKRPFAFYGFNYERGVAEMMHNTSHRTEATMNRAYGPWNLKEPKNNWEKFSANREQSGGLAGVGTCHWPANAAADYDYSNRREASSWASGFLTYPKLDLSREAVSRDTWSKGPDYHLDYMKWYFAHIPRAAGVNVDGRQNNWLKYIFDFQNYDAKGKPLQARAQLHSGDAADPKAAAHTLRVAYHSADLIDPRSLGDEDLAVTGPDGKSLAVKLVGGNESGNRTYRVARYQVTAPGGAWDKAPKGEFTVALRPNRVKSGTGVTLDGARLGAFRVVAGGPLKDVEKIVDPRLPRARLVRAADVTALGAADVTVVIGFESAEGIRVNTLGVGNVRVAGPNGFHQFPELVSVKPGNGMTQTATYRITPPTVKWRDADKGVYTIELCAFQVGDTKGNFAANTTLGRFRVLQAAEHR